MSSYSRTILAVLLTAACGSVSHVSAADRFRLELPDDPSKTSTAILSGDALEVTDSAGQRTAYRARPDLDSADGKFLAFESRAARQFVRWPISGSGTFEIGAPEGGRVRWRPSAMTIVPVATDPPRRERIVPEAGRPLGLTHLAVQSGGDSIRSAWIDSSGELVLVSGLGDRWTVIPTRLRAKLPPGGPLALAQDPLAADTPLVYACDDAGRLIEISGGQRVRTCGAVAGEIPPSFPPEAELVIVRDGRAEVLVACDLAGRLWAYDPPADRFALVEARARRLVAGSPLGVSQGRNGASVFAIDRRGELREYQLAGGKWSESPSIAARLPPGGCVACSVAEGDQRGTLVPLIATVDDAGTLLVGRVIGGRWEPAAFDRSRLPAGTPLALLQSGGVTRIGVVTGANRLAGLSLSAGSWSAATVAEDFAPLSPVAISPNGPTMLALDAKGRLIAATLTGGRWQAYVPGGVVVVPAGPRLVRRTVRPLEPLEPVSVELTNSSKDELAMTLVDLADPERSVEIAIKPGAVKSQRIERDAGVEIEEIYLVPGEAGELIEDVRVSRRSPQPRYELRVFVNQVVSEYFDRTKGKKSPVPDEVTKGLKSIGVFELPAGDALVEGDQIDVFQEASRRNNPGAVRSPLP